MMRATTRFTLTCVRNQVAIIIATLESELGAGPATTYTMPLLQAYENMDRALRGETETGIERADWAGVAKLMVKRMNGLQPAECTPRVEVNSLTKEVRNGN